MGGGAYAGRIVPWAKDRVRWHDGINFNILAHKKVLHSRGGGCGDPLCGAWRCRMALGMVPARFASSCANARDEPVRNSSSDRYAIRDGDPNAETFAVCGNTLYRRSGRGASRRSQDRGADLVRDLSGVKEGTRGHGGEARLRPEPTRALEAGRVCEALLQ